MRTKFLSLVALFVASTGCCVSTVAIAGPKVAYVPNVELGLPAKKNVNAVDVYQQGEKVTRPSVILGSVVVQGAAKQDIQTLVDAARSKASELGADFVLIVKVTTRSKIHSDPAFTSALPFLGGAFAIAHAGDVETQEIPTLLLAVGAYNRSEVGVVWDQDARKQGRFVIRDFKSYSLATAVDLKIDDEIVEINGMDPADKRVQKLLFQSPPGTKYSLRIKRGNERLNADVETVAPPV